VHRPQFVTVTPLPSPGQRERHILATKFIYSMVPAIIHILANLPVFLLHDPRAVIFGVGLQCWGIGAPALSIGSLIESGVSGFCHGATTREGIGAAAPPP
jgi:hypothetical protein